MRTRFLSFTLSCAVVLAGAPSAGERAQLAAGPFTKAPDRQFTADGVTIRYREVGSGDPIILIHGYTASLESVGALANALAAANRVIAFDVRGFGQSSKFADAARYGQLMADDVVRLMDHLKITRAHLVGHSMGALIAANVAARAPTRVASASLVAGPFYPDKAAFEKESAQWINDLESGKGLVGFMQWLFPKLDPKMAAVNNAMILKINDLPALIATLQGLSEMAIASLRSGVPSLVAVGTGDPLHPLSVSFANKSTGAKLLEIEGADHITIIGNPQVIGAIREMIKGGSTSSQMRDAA